MQRLPISLLLLLAVMIPRLAEGVTFDWDNYTWGAGLPTNGTSVSQSFSVAGTNDVTVQISNLNSSSTWDSAYPVVNRYTTGGTTGSTTPPVNTALQLRMLSNNSTGIRITVSFTGYAVRNLALHIWDVDESSPQFIDRIDTIRATTTSLTTVYATSATDYAANSQSGSGASLEVHGTDDADNTSSRGNVDLDFGSTNVITQASFVWRNTGTDFDEQAIGFYNFTYDIAVPEAQTSIPAMALLGVACLSRNRGTRRRNLRQL